MYSYLLVFYIYIYTHTHRISIKKYKKLVLLIISRELNWSARGQVQEDNHLLDTILKLLNFKTSEEYNIWIKKKMCNLIFNKAD